MIYGAYGYTGTLLAEEAARRGHRPLLAGRSSQKLRALGERLGLEWRTFSLDDPDDVDRGITGIDVVLNAAGPFGSTSRPMLDACLRMGTSYADIAGELDAYEAMFERQDEALRAGVMVVPGVGFDVVPTDCLAVRGARELPGATRLELAVGTSGGTSGGTLRATIRMAARGGRARRERRLVDEPIGAHVIAVKLPPGERGMVSAPLSDLVSAYASTAIPNIVTYLIVPSSLRSIAAGAARAGSWLATLGVVRAIAETFIRRMVEGPDEVGLRRGRTETWLRVSRNRESIDYYLDAPGGYAYTRDCAITAVERMLLRRDNGVLTPAQAFGEDFMFTVASSELWMRRTGAWERVNAS
jgi:short subunit dehydrogenase-like uncharacterized protein